MQSDTAIKAPLSAEEVFDRIGYDNFVRGLFNRNGLPHQDFTHAVLGIVTEAHEYLNCTDGANALEELGDLAFYEQALVQVVLDFRGDKDFEYSAVDEDVSYLMELCDEVGPQTVLDGERTDLLDACKRWIGYGKTPPDILALTVRALAYARFVMLVGPDQFKNAFAPHTVRMTNIAKLLERYNGLVFNADRAVNRDLTAERAILETAAG